MIIFSFNCQLCDSGLVTNSHRSGDLRQSSKLSVLNAVKNKLLARVVAVVNKQEVYVKKVA